MDNVSEEQRCECGPKVKANGKEYPPQADSSGCTVM
jgi:hypothetical protein